MEQPANFSELFLGGVAGIIAVVFGAQKLSKGWKSDATETSVMSIMHDELERMATHNATLALELNKLQIEIVTLNQQMRSLIVENQRLHSEVAGLTAELALFKVAMHNSKD